MMTTLLDDNFAGQLCWLTLLDDFAWLCICQNKTEQKISFFPDWMFSGAAIAEQIQSNAICSFFRTYLEHKSYEWVLPRLKYVLQKWSFDVDFNLKKLKYINNAKY